MIICRKNNDDNIIESNFFTKKIIYCNNNKNYNQNQNNYICHMKNSSFYNDLCDYMCSGDCVCCSCYKDCKDPIKDMDTIKQNVRKVWGKDDMKNAMHSSDSLDNVKRESNICFLQTGDSYL